MKLLKLTLVSSLLLGSISSFSAPGNPPNYLLSAGVTTVLLGGGIYGTVATGLPAAGMISLYVVAGGAVLYISDQATESLVWQKVEIEALKDPAHNYLINGESTDALENFFSEVKEVNAELSKESIALALVKFEE